jgi:Uma2 family endonuclease
MSTAAEAPRPATRADLDALPENVVGEIIDGVLYTFPRPRPQHAYVAVGLGGELNAAFQRGRGGPGGWWILIEPGLELQAAPEVVPDLAGWRRERVPALPADTPIRIVPDWVCEILSPSTRAHDQLIKRRFYARVGVPYLWFIDPDARTLSVCKLAEALWVELGVYGPDERIRAEPFDAVELSMGDWWLPGAPASPVTTS